MCNVSMSAEGPVSSGSLKSYSAKGSMDFPSSVLQIDDTPSPVSLDSIVVPAMCASELEKYSDSHNNNSDDCLETDQVCDFVLFKLLSICL